MIQVEPRGFDGLWWRSTGSSRRPCPHGLPGARILIVDDDAGVRDFLGAVLAECGALVHAAASVTEALAQFDRLPPDVVVSDIGMPERDGFALIHEIRRRRPERGGDVPAVALTGFARADDRRRVLASGFQVHVAKPVEPEEILAVVAALVRIAPSR